MVCPFRKIYVVPLELKCLSGVSTSFQAFELSTSNLIQDIDSAVSAETHRWCQDFLKTRHPEVLIQDETGRCRTRPTVNHYMSLRDAVRTHIHSGLEPHFSLVPTPTGASDWRPEVRSLGDVASCEGENALT